MIDYTSQANLSRKLSKVKADLFKFVTDLASRQERFGLLLIVGNFAPSDYKLEKYVQLGANDLEGHAVMYGTKTFKETIEKYRGTDGAFILDSTSGQLLGNKALYLDLKSDVAEERGARHHAAASASKDAYVDFVITVSEEDGATRLYAKGTIESQQDLITEPVEEEQNNNEQS